MWWCGERLDTPGIFALSSLCGCRGEEMVWRYICLIPEHVVTWSEAMERWTDTPGIYVNKGRNWMDICASCSECKHWALCELTGPREIILHIFLFLRIWVAYLLSQTGDITNTFFVVKSRLSSSTPWIRKLIIKCVVFCCCYACLIFDNSKLFLVPWFSVDC